MIIMYVYSKIYCHNPIRVINIFAIAHSLQVLPLQSLTGIKVEALHIFYGITSRSP